MKVLLCKVMMIEVSVVLFGLVVSAMLFHRDACVSVGHLKLF